VEGWTLGRRILSRGGCFYARKVLDVPVRDLTGGFKCFRAETLRAIDYESVRSTGYVFQIELTYRACLVGLEVVEVPIVFRERQAGQSKMSGRIALEAAVLVPRLRWSRRRIGTLRRWPTS
jgi:dolichol-phosphate mannosyltransferase